MPDAPAATPRPPRTGPSSCRLAAIRRSTSSSVSEAADQWRGGVVVAAHVVFALLLYLGIRAVPAGQSTAVPATRAELPARVPERARPRRRRRRRWQQQSRAAAPRRVAGQGPHVGARGAEGRHRPPEAGPAEGGRAAAGAADEHPGAEPRLGRGGRGRRDRPARRSPAARRRAPARAAGPAPARARASGRAGERTRARASAAAPVAAPIGRARACRSPTLVSQVKPQYTTEAMRAKIQGKVWLEVVVMPDGRPGDIKVARSLDRTFGLDEEAIKAMRHVALPPRHAPGRRRPDHHRRRDGVQPPVTERSNA